MGNEAPEGRLFSRLYLDPQPHLEDSARFRNRILGYFWTIYDHAELHHKLPNIVLRELGVTLPFTGNYNFTAFFQTAAIHDVLSTITLVYAYLMGRGYKISAEQWRSSIERAIAEERVSYRIDSKGGIHRSIDGEFGRNRDTAIRALQSKRYGNVSTALASAYEKLERIQQDNKGAVRDCFEAVETLAKLVCDTGTGLDANFVEKRLKPLCQKLYGTDPHATSTSTRLMSAFADWVDAAHPYRHGQKSELPVVLPDDIAIALISACAVFVRWLVDIDRYAGTL